jgi:hypothetical protein
MKLPRNKQLITDKSGKQRIVDKEDPRLPTSTKIQRKKSKKQKPVRRTI